ncbi:MAG TPA: hypothetical protein VHL79_02360 [Ramlibacter sp.]|jgi:NADH dehydrogenase|nr:hypothetical protein [Ramlibacter sp.]
MRTGNGSVWIGSRHGRPMARFAGHHVVADLLGLPLLPLALAARPCAASCRSHPWDTKRTINGERIYPPRSATRADLLAAAAPVVQAAPARAAPRPSVLAEG